MIGTLAHAAWRKSSYSTDAEACVEVADDLPGIVPVRDSKNPFRTALLIPHRAWASFVTAVSADTLTA
ncbi:DUF397 domain-containing protein [Streptomyces blastmyceticus]|uniref:DUF397 domain-containing protein n=1 Tax=Streptomyces blastmyceticus TaxID=68180 RepID=A0ABP3G7P3_9ACTN